MILNQSPDNILFDGSRLYYTTTGYPYILYNNILYIGEQAQGHDELLRSKIGTSPRGYINYPSGRIFNHRDYTIVTFWRNPKINKQFIKQVISKFKLKKSNIVVQIQDTKGQQSIFVPIEQLPNNYNDFMTIQNYESYKQKKNKALGSKPTPNIGRYKMKDMINNPELYFGKLKQTPDSLIFNQNRYYYDKNGFPFLIDPDGNIYIGRFAEGHIDLVKRITTVQRRNLPQTYNMRSGRFFQIGNKQYILTTWAQPPISTSELRDVVAQFKKVVSGINKLYFEIYSPLKPTEFMYVLWQDLPSNQNDYRDPKSYMNYLQKKGRSMSSRSKSNSNKYDNFKFKHKDVLKRPELYFGKLKQNPDNIKYDGRRYKYDENGYPFLIDPDGQIHIGNYSQCHDQLVDRIEYQQGIRLPQKWQMKTGRFFKIGRAYIMTTWTSLSMSKNDIMAVVHQLKQVVSGITEVYYQIYDYDHKVQSLFVPVQNLPANPIYFQTPKTFITYTAKRQKSMASKSNLSKTKYDTFKYSYKDIKDNPELYFGQMKQKKINKILRRLREL